MQSEPDFLVKQPTQQLTCRYRKGGSALPHTLWLWLEPAQAPDCSTAGGAGPKPSSARGQPLLQAILLSPACVR